MFPLVHYFVNSEICAPAPVPPLMALGSLWPDLAAAAGWQRDPAHECGADLYRWCRENAPDGLDLARGVISHGSEPHGVDWLADEHCQADYPKGWCFQQGEPYKQQVQTATGLPGDMIWWKSHNFVEMGCELLTDQARPQIKKQLLAAVGDQTAVTRAAAILHQFCGAEPERILRTFAQVPLTFAIDPINPQRLAESQCQAFVRRHQHHGGDPTAMAALLQQIQAELAPCYPQFMAMLVDTVRATLAAYQ